MIVIVDYKTGNLGSIQNMLRKIGVQSLISDKKKDLEEASKLILPGVGSFDYGMLKLEELQLIDVLHRKVLDEKTPLLGICLGAQLCCLTSEEGVKPGFGWIKAHVKKFPTQQNGKRFPVPHMGWDFIKTEKESKLFEGITDARFYFVHSYYIDCTEKQDILGSNVYSTAYQSSFEKNNIIGVQFHPEKSHKFGQKLLKNFIEKY